MLLIPALLSLLLALWLENQHAKLGFSIFGALLVLHTLLS